MNLFKRLFKIGQSEAHSLVDQLENPIRLSEQGIRDMKEDLEKSLKALAEVKALAIRAKNDAATAQARGQEYEQKAILLLKQAERGELDAAEADRLATAALTKKEEQTTLYNQAMSDQSKFDASVAKLDGNIKNLRANISKWENELKTLKARAKVSEATVNVNKQLANIDSSSTVSMLERMKEKVDQQEALAESYADIANESKSVDDEIEKALKASTSSSSDALAALKAKLSGNNQLPPSV